ncbi:DinB family protein [Pontibacillus yanchengensis]|nr:DinB family protein [Pontibacillus yanchengensis]
METNRKDDSMYGLDEKRQEVLNFVDTLSNEKATTKPDQHTWSVVEVLEHLYLMENVVIKQIEHAIKNGEVKEVGEKPIHKTTIRTQKVDAPETVQPKGHFQTIEDAKQGLEQSREATLFLIHNKDQELLQHRTFPHPLFGDMNLEQWIEFIGWHELRHLEQMKEVHNQLA